MDTDRPQVVTSDGDQKTATANVGDSVLGPRIPWVDYDPIMESMRRDAEHSKTKPVWTGD